LFASHREFRKEKGRLYLEFIEKFFPEEKIIRIVGQKASQYAKFVKQPDIQKHDVVVDESPDSPDFKEQVWAGLQEILPALLKQGVAIPAEVLAYSPLPSEVAESLQKAMQGAQQMPPQAQKQIEQMQQALDKAGQDLQKLTQENQELKADQQTEVIKIKAKEQADQRSSMVKIEQAQIEAAVDQRTALLEAKIEKWKAEMEQRTDIIVANIQAAASVKAAKEKPRPTKQ